MMRCFAKAFKAIFYSRATSVAESFIQQGVAAEWQVHSSWPFGLGSPMPNSDTGA